MYYQFSVEWDLGSWSGTVELPIKPLCFVKISLGLLRTNQGGRNRELKVKEYNQLVCEQCCQLITPFCMCVYLNRSTRVCILYRPPNSTF